MMNYLSKAFYMIIVNSSNTVGTYSGNLILSCGNMLLLAKAVNNTVLEIQYLLLFYVPCCRIQGYNLVKFRMLCLRIGMCIYSTIQ